MVWGYLMPDRVKKGFCSYLIHQYLGKFLKEKITHEQLSVEMYHGKCNITDVQLNVDHLNEELKQYNVPFEIVDGYIGSIDLFVPWTTIMTDNSVVTISNLEVTIKPKPRNDTTGRPFDSTILNSMTYSMHLAQEVLKQEQPEGEQRAGTALPFEGLEMFAQCIEAVFNKVKCTFIDIVIRLEHVQKGFETGEAFEVRISRFEYFDDSVAGNAPTTVPTDEPAANATPTDRPVLLEASSLMIKNFHLVGLKVFCGEYRPECRSMYQSHEMAEWEQPRTLTDDSDDMSEPSASVYSMTNESFMTNSHTTTSSRILSPPLHESSPTGKGGCTKDAELMLIAVLSGQQTLKLTMKQIDQLPGANVELDCNIGSVNVHLSPHIVHLLTGLVEGITAPASSDVTNMKCRDDYDDDGDDIMISSTDYDRLMKTHDNEFKTRYADGRGGGGGGGGGVDRRTEDQIHSDFQSLSYEDMTNQPLDDDAEDGDTFLYTGDQHHFGDGLSEYQDEELDGSITSSVSVQRSTAGGSSVAYAVNYKKSTPQSTAPSSLKSNLSSRPATKPSAAAVKLKSKAAANSTQPRRAAQQQHSTHHQHQPATTPTAIDPSSDQHRLKVKVNFLSVVVLHEDPAARLQTEDGEQAMSSAERLKEITDMYFTSVTNIPVSGVTTPVEMTALRAEYSRISPIDHLGLLCKPICLDLHSNSSAGTSVLSSDVSVGLLDFVEAVFDRRRCTNSAMGFHLPIENILPEYCELLTFDESDCSAASRGPHSAMYTSMGVALAPNLKIHCQSTTCHFKNSKKKKVPTATLR